MVTDYLFTYEERKLNVEFCQPIVFSQYRLVRHNK